MGRLSNTITALFQRLGWIGDFSRLTFDGKSVSAVAVVVRRNDHWCSTHAGIAHIHKGQLWILHLGGHERVYNDLDDGSWVFAIPKLIEEDGDYLAGFCRRVADARTTRVIPYTFEYEPDVYFDQTTGLFVSRTTTDGLTCSTFVAAVFRSANLPLINLHSWPSHASLEDLAAREWLLEIWQKSRRQSLIAQAAKIKSSIRARRVSPEQVAGACLQRVLPAQYKRCRANGEAILAALDQKFGPPPPRPTGGP